MKRIALLMLIILNAAALGIGPVLAGQVGTLIDFKGGTPAVADDVDQNFSDVRDEVNDNDTRISTNATAIQGKQNRVTGTCPAGQSIRVVNADGTVSCEIDSIGGDGHSLDASDGSPANVVYVSAFGDVGIGTTTPTDPLVLYTSNTNCINCDGFRIDSDECNVGGGITLAASDTTSRLYVYNTCKSPNHIVLYGGNVGVGYTNPAYKLDVSGGDVNTRDGGYRDAGACVAGTCASDRKLKKNIKPLSNSLDKIARLEPVSYEFKDKKYGPGEQYGLVAQDLEKVFPEWVVEDKDGNKSIKYGLQFQMLMINAIKELKEKNEKLEAEIASLKRN